MKNCNAFAKISQRDVIVPENCDVIVIFYIIVSAATYRYRLYFFFDFLSSLSFFFITEWTEIQLFFSVGLFRLFFKKLAHNKVALLQPHSIALTTATVFQELKIGSL